MPISFIDIIKSLFQDASVLVNINDHATSPFEIHKDVRQGCPLAPYLFNIIVATLNATIKMQ